ncbi:unnamed protein product [Hyaloperonospora brassicae]|uniref:BED-type domain-containing protein n=1 Tax=Hyaloperonospora brassicae TaxID=162125 RepID=A0AAV0UN90_HYABA|nr:unnamed protein product [Hyaloperonospora brassicae]
MTSTPAANSADICSFFFEPVAERPPLPEAATPTSTLSSGESLVPQTDRKTTRVVLGGANRHRCKVCQNVYTQAASTGYTNLLTHLRLKHPDYTAMFESQRLVPVSVAPGPPPRSRPHSTDVPSSSAPSSGNFGPKTAGRKRGPVYDHFVDVPPPVDSAVPTLKVKKMRCLYCRCDTPQLSGRLRLHLAAKCVHVPPNVKAMFTKTGTDMSLVPNTVVTADPTAPTLTGTSVLDKPMIPAAESVSNAAMSLPERFAPPSSGETSVIDSTATRTKREVGTDWQTVEDQLTTALVATRCPWTLLDNAAFRSAMELVRRSDVDAFPLTAARARTDVLDRLVVQYDRDSCDALASSSAITVVASDATEEDEDGDRSGATSTSTYIAVDEWQRAFVLSVGHEAAAVPDVAALLSVLSKVQSVSPSAKLFLCTSTAGAYAHARTELLRDASAAAKPVVLMGACVIQQTALLVRELVLGSASLEEALDNAVLLADALDRIPSLHQHVLLRVVSDTSNIDGHVNAFAHVSRTSWRSIAIAVKQATRLEAMLRLAISEENDASSPMLHRLIDMGGSDSVWTNLRHTDQLLAPAHFVSVLSEMPTTTSGQMLALWIWLFGVAMHSPLFDDQSDVLRAKFERRLACYAEEHFLACLVLDPRVHGVGLSVSGLRRCRGVAVCVAGTLLSSFDESNFIRSYNDYMKQQGDFGEPGVWNSANTSNPIEFWNDYEGDALHDQLAVVAKTVCSFVPHTCSLADLWTAHSRPSRRANDGSSEEHEKCTKLRYGAARSARATVMDVVKNHEMLLDVENELSWEKVMQPDVAIREKDEQDSSRNGLVRIVLERIQDGVDKDTAGFSTLPTSVDASWFDVSSAGLDKIRSTMEKYLSAATQP